MMMGYVTRQAAPTPQFRESREEKQKRQADAERKRAALAQSITAKALEGLTPEQRAYYPYLPLAQRQYVLTNKKWPKDAPLPEMVAKIAAKQKQRLGGIKGGQYKRKQLDVRVIIDALGWEEMTVRYLCRNKISGFGDKAVREACECGVERGLLIKAQRGRFWAYRAVQS